MITTRATPRYRWLAIILLLALTAPVAAAGHWTLYETTNPGATYEDDGHVINAPGNPLHGRENRVTALGATPGSGGLFLDARLGADARGFHVFGDAIGAAAIGRPDVLPPGPLRPSAWYGWWQDLDLDGIIDDVHDGACEGAACAGDEFVWRGVGSGDTVGMVNYLIPYVAVSPVAGGGPFTNPENFRRTHMEDGTAHDRPSQEWVGIDYLVVVDGSTLTTIQTMTVAGAAKTNEFTFFYDLEDPAGLHDVDRYEAVSPDAAALWSTALGAASNPGATLSPVFDALDTVADPVLAALNATSVLVGEILDQVPPLPDGVPPAGVGDVQVLYNGAVATAWATLDAWTITPYPKEPNTAEDDYEGRALFGGHGDQVGSGNAYDGYAHEFHFYADVLSRFKPCVGAAVAVPSTSIENGAGPVCRALTTPLYDPEDVDWEGVALDRGRSTGTHLTFETRPVLWHDANHDTHLGNVCDPDSESFDAERNTCRTDTPGYPYPWPNKYTSEFVDVCGTTSGRSFGIVLTPIGGPWKNAVVHRDYAAVGRSPDGAIEVHDDEAPITLRWAGGCEGINAGLTTRDALIVAPGAGSVAVRVEARLGIPGFKDVEAGLDVGEEHVFDIDYLAASL